MSVGSVFDILGPIMVGPSSSHTAGALRIARLALSLCPAPITEARLTLYKSFAKTHAGHGTDRALVAGLLGFDPDDPRIRDSFALAEKAGMHVAFSFEDGEPEMHPNTVDISVTLADGERISVRGESVGGGKARLTLVNGISVDLTGAMPSLFVAHRDVPGMLAMMTSALGNAGVNIARMSSYRTTPGNMAYAVFEMDSAPQDVVCAYIRAARGVESVQLVPQLGDASSPDVVSALDFSDGAGLLALCRERGMGIGEVMRARETDIRGDEGTVDAMMARVLRVMREEVSSAISDPVETLGGMIEGNAALFAGAQDKGCDLCGSVVTRAGAYAMATIERSASMGVIVAAPTAGASGVLPGALLALAEARHLDDKTLTRALFTAAAVGAVYEHNASVSGAQGGCQAEVGTASAMAAAALVDALGGTAQDCANAAVIATGNLLGLVCDPVRGLVEVPCQVRNVIGVADAFTAAQLALCGVRLPLTFDEAVEASRQVGAALPETLRETAMGGFAAVCGATGGCDACGGCA